VDAPEVAKNVVNPEDVDIPKAATPAKTPVTEKSEKPNDNEKKKDKPKKEEPKEEKKGGGAVKKKDEKPKSGKSTPVEKASAPTALSDMKVERSDAVPPVVEEVKKEEDFAAELLGNMEEIEKEFDELMPPKNEAESPVG
jgi:hypothetical protein